MEKTPSCKEFRLMADEYIEGELTAAEMRDLEAHLAECDECRKEFEELRALKEALRSAKEEVPEGLHSRIMASIEAKPNPKPQRKTAFFRSAAISAACVMLCLSATLAITIIPMLRSNEGGEGLPNDPQYSLDNTIVEECNTELKSESALSKPTDENVEAEQTSAPVVDPAPEVAPSDTVPIPETTAVAETMAVVETIVPETMAAAGIATSPETDLEMQAPAEETSKSALNDESGNKVLFQKVESEASSAPDGNEITLALLIVSGLLAVASFVAFLISLSSVRTSSEKKESEDKE